MNIILRRRKLGLTSCNAIAAFSSVPFQVARNDIVRWPDVENSVVIRWGCTSTIPNRLNSRILNKAASIHLVCDKRSFRMRCQAERLRVPLSFNNREDFLENAPPGEYIVRPSNHHQGRNLFFFNSKAGAARKLQEIGDGYISSFIHKVREYRVYVIQGRVACVAEKIPENREDVAWNHHLGATFNNVRWGDWPLLACVESIRAAKLAEIDFCGVDVMEDANGDIFILEANSAPSLTSEYRQRCFAKCFSWMVENNSFDPINHDIRLNNLSWKKLIHPAISLE